MIRHIVMWRVVGATPQEKELASVKQSFEKLRGRIPGMTSLEVGLDSSAVDYACDVVLIADFDSQDALDAYSTHPEHVAVRDELAGVRIARHQVDFAA
jgi:hypothetical protein